MTQIRKVALSKIKPNDNNPRNIKDHRFQKLVANMQAFPQMLELRPIVVDDEGVILGGNMRYRAALHLGWKEVPVLRAGELTEEQKQDFIILDNQDFGDWDFDVLANTYEPSKLMELGFEAQELGIRVDAPEFIAGGEDNSETDIGDEEDFETSHVKMVQLFLTQNTYPKFLEMVMKLQEKHATDNVTDTVFKVIEDAYNNC